jgi:hypothetical protein
MYQGVEAAVEELERSVTELGLVGLKLYPMYQHWAVNDPGVAFPIFEKAEALDVPVMIHQAGSTRIDAKLELGRPAMLDDVAVRSGISGDRRPLRPAVGRRGSVPADEASELLRGAVVPDRERQPPGSVLVAVECEPMFVPLEAVLRHRLPGVPLRARGG